MRWPRSWCWTRCSSRRGPGSGLTYSRSKREMAATAAPEVRARKRRAKAGAAHLDHAAAPVVDGSEEPRPLRWTRAEYLRMAELGILRPGSRSDLIDGQIFERRQQSP